MSNQNERNYNTDDISIQEIKESLMMLEREEIVEDDEINEVLLKAVNFNGENGVIEDLVDIQTIFVDGEKKRQLIISLNHIIPGSNIDLKELGIDPWEVFTARRAFCLGNIDYFSIEDYFDTQRPVVLVLD
jgi:hypothetical protein